MIPSQIEPLEARIAPATLSIAPTSITEGNSGKTSLNFTVTLSEAETSAVTVDFATGNTTAEAGGLFPDYEAQTGTLTFAAGETSKTIAVQVLGDQLMETDETLQVTLSNPTVATIDTATATGTIEDDGDTGVAVTISNAADVTEGAGVVSKFTVTLASAPTTNVTVNYSTGAAADTAKPAPGTFTDYTTKTGTLTFTPGGPLTQEISIALTDDAFREDTEQFTVTLTGATGGALSTSPSAVGKILNDTDATFGILLGDRRLVEGSADSTITFTPTFSGSLGTAFNLTLSTQNGTAAGGGDFEAKTQTFAFTANQTSANFAVKIKGDSVFETAESFFVNVSGIPSSVSVVNAHPVNPAAQLSARVYVFDDDVGAVGTKQLRWTDVDGDLVTLTVNKGSLVDGFGRADANRVNFLSKGSVGGRELLALNLNNSTFAGANVTLTATKQTGFPDPTDGRVNVGIIQAADFIAPELQVNGVDLGSVTVDGDLAKITAGDQFSTPAIRKLDVYSLGTNAAIVVDLQNQAGKPPDPNDIEFIQSDVVGPISTLNVATDVGGFVHVIGAEFGVIGTLNIKGALKGGTAENSGRITASGRIGKTTIGSIEGGSGENSGLLSGTNLTNGVLGTVIVNGDVKGGSGASSGTIFSSLNLASVTIGGSLIGGSGNGSGGIVAGGTIAKILIEKDLKGGDSRATLPLDRSGYISATKVSSVTIGRDILAGKDLGKGVQGSGAIQVDVIGALLVKGSVKGQTVADGSTRAVPVIISASGLTDLLAIKSVKILGSATETEILAGYQYRGLATNAMATDGKVQRGIPVNADASIGTIEIGSGQVTNVIKGLNIVAGVEPTATGRLGETTNTVIKAVTGTSLNDPTRSAQIASVLLRGTVTANTEIYGIVAQSLGSIKYGPTGTTVIALTAGAGNDTTAKELGTGSKFQALELATEL